MDVSEDLTVKNFAGIKSLHLKLSPFTVIIGPQSVGKSVVAKLLYFFQNIPQFLGDAALEETPPPPRDTLIERFTRFFPVTGYDDQESSLVYRQGNYSISVKRTTDTGEWRISLPRKVGEAYSIFVGSMYGVPQSRGERAKPLARDNDAAFHYWQSLDAIFPNSLFQGRFIPAGRSFYAQIQANMAAFFSKASLDEFVTEFGIFIDRTKRRPAAGLQDAPLARAARSLCEQLLSGKYRREGGEDFIDAMDGRRLPAALWSSGQQEAQPLTAVLLHFCERPTLSGPLFIEEPEAHLFPASQRTITELIALAFHVDPPHSRVFITTHSPYILTTINNLLLAGQLYTDGRVSGQKKRLSSLVAADRALAPGSVGAFLMDQNGCRSIVDEETGLIGASAIDEVSGDLNEQFDELLNLRYR